MLIPKYQDILALLKHMHNTEEVKLKVDYESAKALLEQNVNHAFI